MRAANQALQKGALLADDADLRTNDETVQSLRRAWEDLWDKAGP
jgi:hypothetical protein